MLSILMSHHDFDKVLEKLLSPRDLPYIRDTVNNLRQKVQESLYFKDLSCEFNNAIIWKKNGLCRVFKVINLLCMSAFLAH